MNRCPNCGKFIDAEPMGFFDRLDRTDELGPVYAFCNEPCADQYHVKQLRDEPRPLSYYNEEST